MRKVWYRRPFAGTQAVEAGGRVRAFRVLLRAVPRAEHKRDRAFRQMFTGWGLGEEYFAQAFESLGMSSVQFLLLAVSLAAMAVLYRFPQETDSEKLPLDAACSRVNYNSTTAAFIYGVIAVAISWLALLAGSDLSGFAYFQF